MSLDLREGYTLVMSGVDYPILFCGIWETANGSTRSMRHMCSSTATLKRPPAVSGAVRGALQADTTPLKCTPLDPVTQADLSVRNIPRAPYELRKTIVDGGDTFYELYVENIKR